MVYLTLQTILNEKVVNYKIVDLIEDYNFDVDFVSHSTLLIFEI